MAELCLWKKIRAVVRQAVSLSWLVASLYYCQSWPRQIDRLTACRTVDGYSTLEIPSGLIIMNEHSPLAALQNNVPRRTIFVFVASGKVKLKFAVFNPALIGSSFSSP